MSSDRYTGRAVVVGEYAGADSTIILAIDQRVDIIKKSEKWWYVSDGAVKGYFPALCLRELHPDEVPPLPQGWNKNISSDGRMFVLIIILHKIVTSEQICRRCVLL